jgi:flagellar protein FlbT
MSLKITLKPHERMIIGGAVVTNGSTKSELYVENTVPLLRQKDIMGEQDAKSLCRQVYFTVQLMYIDEENLSTHHNTYWKIVKVLVKAAPSMVGFIDQISELVLSRQYYSALKIAQKLIDYEQEVLHCVS